MFSQLNDSERTALRAKLVSAHQKTGRVYFVGSMAFHAKVGEQMWLELANLAESL